MTGRIGGWLLVAAAVTAQFLCEVTLGRFLVAPAIVVPLLVYLGLNSGDYWMIEGAFWSGLVLDFLLNQTPGTSSLAMILGLWLSDSILRVTTGAVRMTFIAHAFVASLLSDLFFVLFAASPPGSGFSALTLLLIPRIALPLILFQSLPLLFAGRNAGKGLQ